MHGYIDMTSPTIPGKFLSRLTALGLPTDQLKKVIHVFLAFVEFRDGKAPKANGHAVQPDLLGSGPSPWPEDFVAQFWHSETGYPRRVGKAAAIRRLQIIEKSGTVPFKTIMAGVSRFRRATERTAVKFIPHPATWLHDARWQDDPRAVAAGGKEPQISDRNGYTSLLREMHENEQGYCNDDGHSDLGSSDEGYGSRRRIL